MKVKHLGYIILGILYLSLSYFVLPFLFSDEVHESNPFYPMYALGTFLWIVDTTIIIGSLVTNVRLQMSKHKSIRVSITKFLRYALGTLVLTIFAKLTIESIKILIVYNATNLVKPEEVVIVVLWSILIVCALVISYFEIQKKFDKDGFGERKLW